MLTEEIETPVIEEAGVVVSIVSPSEVQGPDHCDEYVYVPVNENRFFQPPM